MGMIKWSNRLKNLYLLSRMYLTILMFILSITVASCGQKGDLVRPAVEEEKSSPVEELKSL